MSRTDMKQKQSLFGKLLSIMVNRKEPLTRILILRIALILREKQNMRYTEDISAFG